MDETPTPETQTPVEKTGVLPVGRPTLYSPEILEKSKRYLTDYLKQDEVIPSIEGLAVYLGISRETIRRWAKDEDKADFCGIIETLLAKQAKVLANKGLSGDFNAPITKLLLSKHGYVEKQELEHQNPDGNLKTIIINKYASPNQPVTEADGSVGSV